MSIKSIDQKFTSANSVAVERAVVTREEWEVVKAATEYLAEALECHQASGFGNSTDFEYQVFARSQARKAFRKYKEAKQ